MIVYCENINVSGGHKDTVPQERGRRMTKTTSKQSA
jgi:hypothetical protein